MQDAVAAAIRSGLIRSAHDCSEGGLAVTLAECCISGEKRLGAQIDLATLSGRSDDLLFNEAPSRVVVSILPGKEKLLQEICKSAGTELCRLGTVGGPKLEIKIKGRTKPSVPVSKLYTAWYHSIAKALGEK